MNGTCIYQTLIFLMLNDNVQLLMQIKDKEKAKFCVKSLNAVKVKNLKETISCELFKLLIQSGWISLKIFTIFFMFWLLFLQLALLMIRIIFEVNLPSNIAIEIKFDIPSKFELWKQFWYEKCIKLEKQVIILKYCWLI